MEVWREVVVPPTLPPLVKRYAKAAIRTQPYDLLVWSAAYFKALAAGKTPPVKTRLELTPSGSRALTMGYIRLFISQFGRSGEVEREEIEEKWRDVSLPVDQLESMLTIGSVSESTVDWPRFIALAAALISQNLKETMMKVCELLTEEEEGGSAAIPSQLFISLYRFLAEIEAGDDQEPSEDGEEALVVKGIGGKVPDDVISFVESYVEECGDKQGGMFMPRNLRHSMCPSLEQE